MQRFAFLSRHTPTEVQIALAQEQDIEIIPVGDSDAFSVSLCWMDKEGDFDGVIVVHPAAAMRLCSSYLIGVFENASRAPVGEKPTFGAVALHIFDMRD
jgi:hypothetical protein